MVMCRILFCIRLSFHRLYLALHEDLTFYRVKIKLLIYFLHRAQLILTVFLKKIIFKSYIYEIVFRLFT